MPPSEIFLYSLFLFFFSSQYSSLYNFQICKEERVIKQPKDPLFWFQNYLLRLLAQATAFLQYTVNSDFDCSIYIKFLATGTCLLILELNSHEIQRTPLPNYISCSIVGDLNELIQRMPLIQCTLQLCPCDDAAVSSNINYVSDMEITILTFYNTVRFLKRNNWYSQSIPLDITLKQTTTAPTQPFVFLHAWSLFLLTDGFMGFLIKLAKNSVSAILQNMPRLILIYYVS